jgi:ribosome biogenesis GTPase
VLKAYGWDAHFESAMAELGTNELVPGRVVEEQRGMVRLMTAAGECRAELAGRMRQGGDWPTVGDWVAVQSLAKSRGLVHHVLPRKSKISRKAPGKQTQEQVLAANLDTVFMVTSCNDDHSLRRIERYLTMIWESGARPVVLLNKSDLTDDLSGFVQGTEAGSLGVAVHAICALRDDGLDPMRPYLDRGMTVALIGSSGVGKSTIVNRLMGEEVQGVREVRGDDAKGRHTTRSRQLFLIPGGALILDTPGLRELALWMTDSGLDQTFADIAELAAGCRFDACSHGNEPDCAVRNAIAEGTLASERVESYGKLRRELEFLERRTDPAARANAKSRWREIHKSVRIARDKGWIPPR